MNIYFCHHKDAECGLYVVADTIGRRKPFMPSGTEWEISLSTEGM